MPRSAQAEAVVVVAAIGAPFGVRGFSHLRSFTDPPDNVLDYPPWLARLNGRWMDTNAENERHRGGIVTRLAGIDNRDDAAALKGVEIGVPAASLPVPNEDEFYWRDLVGREVCNLEGVALGTVANMMATGAHDVMVLNDHGEERLIPFVRAHVLSVASAVPASSKPGPLLVDWQPDWN